MNDDCYVLSSSSHQFEKMCAGYTVHIMMVVLQFYNFINVQYPLFFAGRMAFYLKREVQKKAEGQFTKRRDKTPYETMSYVTRVI